MKRIVLGRQRIVSVLFAVIVLVTQGCGNSTTADGLNEASESGENASKSGIVGSSDGDSTNGESSDTQAAGAIDVESSNQAPIESNSNSTRQANDAQTNIAQTNIAQTNIAQADGKIIDISFEDLKLPIQENMVVREFMITGRPKELNGKRIRINGVMLPDTKLRGISEFILLKNIECKFGPGGQADHLLNVRMTEKNDTIYHQTPISIEGVLTINPTTGFDGNTWSIYDLACDRVSKYRPNR